jgi:GTP cyclohydrolase IA
MVCMCGEMTAREYALQAERQNMAGGVFHYELEENIKNILRYIGEDVDREGLKETPNRVIKSYHELFSGYREKSEDVIKVFNEVSCDEMVICKDIEFFSTCEHHMIPFFGKAHIAYIPEGRVIGLSKLARVLEIYSRRLQVQERLTTQITDALDQHLKPKGSACVIEAQHLCCMARGVGKQDSKMVTSSLTGVFRKQEVRMELLALLGK